MRRYVVPLLSVVLLVAAAVAILTYLQTDAPRMDLVLAEVDGKVVVTTPDGKAADATGGTVLAPRDKVSTGDDGRAVLAIGQETRIRLDPKSGVQVRSIDEDGAVRLELENGRLEATVRPGSGSVKVGNQGRDVLLTDGRVKMGVGDDGTFVTEMVEGSAITSGFAGVSRIDAGQRATATQDGKVALEPIPQELLLAVQWPEEKRTRDGKTRVTGKTEPGAHVKLEGGPVVVEVVADAAGEFAADVPLAEGDNTLRVSAVDVMGRDALVDGFSISRDTHGPGFRGGVDYKAP